MNEHIPGRDCPCEPVKKLEKRVDDHDLELAKGNTTFAVINTKLNFIIAVMSFLGAAFGGYLVSAMFQ